MTTITRLASSYTTGRKAIAIDANVLFGNGLARQTDNFNSWNLGVIKTIHDQNAQLIIVLPDNTRATDGFALSQTIKADNIVQQRDDSPLAEFVTNLERVSQFAPERILYISSDAQRAQAVTDLKLNAHSIAIIPPQDSAQPDTAPRTSRDSMTTLTQIIQKHLGVR